MTVFDCLRRAISELIAVFDILRVRMSSLFIGLTDRSDRLNRLVTAGHFWGLKLSPFFSITISVKAQH